MKTRAVLIFSGYNDRAVLAFCRYAQKRKIPFYIVASGKTDLIYRTGYLRNILCNRREAILGIEDVLDYVELIKIKSKHSHILILPSSEYLNRFLLLNYDVLNKNKVQIGLCSKSTYELLSDKLSFGKLCESLNIRTPLGLNEDNFDFPIVIKPKSYFSSTNKIYKPEVITNRKNLDFFLEERNINDFYLQEYVPGKSVYLLYYIFPNGSYSVFSQENFIQQYNGGSMILAKSSSYHEYDISAQFANLLKGVNFSGLIMIELKFYKNRFYMIEANPRLWGPSQLILDSGMDLFECFAYDNKLIKKIKTENYKIGAWYYWSGGLAKNLEDNVPLMYHDFTPTDFRDNKIEIEKWEIYNRRDSNNVYELENKKL